MAIEANVDDRSLSPFSLSGQHALVTGAGSGIGRATARLFAATGANVVVTDLVPESAERVAGEIVSAGGKAIGLECDVGREDHITEAFARAEDHFGDLDVLVCSAAYRMKHHSMSMSVEQWDAMHDVTVRGTYLCNRQALRRMKASGRGGAIVNVSSAAALRPAVLNNIDYDSAKAGVNAITRAFALEFTGSGIRVNAVMPGSTRREGAPDFGDVEMTGPFVMPERILMNRQADPIEQARAILFLASPAASYISGVCLLVDGATMLS